MMDKAGKERMFGFMMDMCCKGMSEEDKTKMREQFLSRCKDTASVMSQLRNMCKGMPEGFNSCCSRMDFSGFTKGCCGGQRNEKSKD
jgi:hypothetical protein